LISPIADGTLRIVDIQPEEDGYYTCRAENPAGKEDIVVKVAGNAVEFKLLLEFFQMIRGGNSKSRDSAKNQKSQS
jgi:hypothetical protein